MNNVTREGTIDWSKIRRVPCTPKQRAELLVERGDLCSTHEQPELVGKCALFPGRGEPSRSATFIDFVRGPTLRTAGTYAGGSRSTG